MTCVGTTTTARKIAPFISDRVATRLYDSAFDQKRSHGFCSREVRRS